MIKDSATIRDIVKEEKVYQRSRPNSAYVPKSRSPRQKRISRNQRRLTGVNGKIRPTTAKNIKPNSYSNKYCEYLL